MLFDDDSPTPKDPHQVLGISPGSSVEAVTAAYERLRRTYATDSLAGYSLISNREREDQLRAIERAYVALTGGERKASAPVTSAPRPLAAPVKRHVFLESALEEAEARAPAPPRQVPFQACDGATLRQMRLQQGWSVADLAGRTKIQKSHIEALEEERVKRLPAPVYLKGYIRTLLQELGAENPSAMAEGYAARVLKSAPPETRERRWSLFKA